MKLRKPLGRPLVRRGCNWCQRGQNDPAGICDECVQTFRRMLQSKRWTKLRRAFLSIIANKFCNRCRKLHGGLVLAEDLHHTEDWRTHPSEFWDETKLEPLCHSCHSAETMSQQHDSGNLKNC